MRSKRIAVIYYFNKRILALIMFFLIIGSLIGIYVLTQDYEIERVVVYSPDFKAEHTITNDKLLDEFQKVLDKKVRLPSKKLKSKAKYRMRVDRRIGSDDYAIIGYDLIYDEEDRDYGKLNELLEREIKRSLLRLEEISPFGRLVPWEDIDNYFPRYSKAIIRDLETGLSFRVQRRAGSKHSDVQPITKEDSAIFKKIYDGKWSWRRRAVVVEVDDKKIAASMNGMPHGAGAIDKNNFSGHFCLHFLDSRVHTSNKVDPAHQVMVWKSAGKFDEFIAKQAPADFPNLFFTLLDQQDETLLNYILQNDEKSIHLLIDNLSRAKLDSSEIIVNQKQLKSYQGEAKIIDLKQKETLIDFEIRVVPNKDFKGWIIESVTLS